MKIDLNRSDDELQRNIADAEVAGHKNDKFVMRIVWGIAAAVVLAVCGMFALLAGSWKTVLYMVGLAIILGLAQKWMGKRRS